MTWTPTIIIIIVGIFQTVAFIYLARAIVRIIVIITENAELDDHNEIHGDNK